MNDPLVSAIVTVKNGERFLAAALASIRSQGYAPLEILVVDGQSVDGTASIAMAAPDVRYIRQHGDGLAMARNQGIREARGELIAFLDADDEWIAGKLRRQVDFLREHAGVHGTITRLRFLVEPDLSGRAPGLNRFYGTDMIGYTPGTLLARQALVCRMGPFDPAFSVACDVDWFARMLDSAQPVRVLNEVLLIKHIHGSNMSLDRGRVRYETMAVLRNSLLRKRGRRGSPPDGAGWPTGWGIAGSGAAQAGDAT